MVWHVQNGSLGRLWYGIVQNSSLGRIWDGMIHRMVHWVEKYGMA
jgi:hypothetical protein